MRLIYEWNWFGGIVAFAIGGLIASVISGWLAAKFLNSWIDAGLVEETITLRGGKTETLQYVGGLEWPTFVSALCGIICGLLVSIIFAMFAGPFFGDLVALTAEGDRVEHPLQRADAASNAGIVSSFAVLLLLFGVPAACGLFFYVVRTVFQMQTQAE
ncbi:MAG: hypothetical protein H7124_12960 [Phycisphaerales bacterium]|nr:hypothetical protein [Hyphomonadaceae bacterium]